MNDIQSLIQQISRLEDRLASHLQEGALHTALMQNLAQNVTRLDHTVYGNGKEGLVTVIARTDERLQSVIECLDGLPAAMQGKIDSAIEKAIMKAEAPKDEPSGADKIVKWVGDKVLPYFVTGFLIIVLQAIWELVRMRLSTP